MGKGVSTVTQYCQSFQYLCSISKLLQYMKEPLHIPQSLIHAVVLLYTIARRQVTCKGPCIIPQFTYLTSYYKGDLECIHLHRSKYSHIIKKQCEIDWPYSLSSLPLSSHFVSTVSPDSFTRPLRSPCRHWGKGPEKPECRLVMWFTTDDQHPSLSSPSKLATAQ